MSRDHGRVPLLARGARRPRAAMRGLLMGFQPLELGWFGGGEVKTLAKAEWLGGVPLLGGRCLLLGYYLNELLLKLLPREDAHPPCSRPMPQAVVRRWRPRAAMLPSCVASKSPCCGDRLRPDV
jgi:hypothetical protein